MTSPQGRNLPNDEDPRAVMVRGFFYYHNLL